MRRGSVTEVLFAGGLGPPVASMRPIAERLVLAEPAPTQVNGRCFLDDVPVGVLHDHSTGYLVGTVFQWRDDYALVTHVVSISVPWRWRALEQAVFGQFRERPVAGDGGSPESDQSVEKDSGDGGAGV